ITSSDVQTLKEKGGILKSLPLESNIQVKELDYSYFLSFTTEELSMKEEEIWDTLFEIANKKPQEHLPESSMELLLDFFKDTKKSARLLNKVYKNALNQLSGEKTIQDIRKAITQISNYLKQQPQEKAREGQINIMSILIQLHIDLLTSLFRQSSTKDSSDLSEDIIKNFSDTDIAEFISSLILSEGSINERLLRIFDKIVPDDKKSSTVAPLVADQLFSQNIIHPFKLEPLQMSIKEIFKQNPKSPFINEMYEITVDAVINKNIDNLTYIAKLSPEITRFVQSMKDTQLPREKALLLINLLNLENNPNDFKKLNRNLLDLLPVLLQQKDVTCIRDIFDFFTQKINPDQKQNLIIGNEIMKTVQTITSPQIIQQIISYIPEANTDLPQIVYILQNLKKQSVVPLISAYLKRPGSVDKVKFKKVFSVMKGEIVAEILNRFKSPKTYEIKILFPLLQQHAPDKAKIISRQMIESSNNQILFSVLDNYNPENQEELNRIYQIFSKNNDKEIKKKAAAILLKTRNKKIIESLFQKANKSLFKKSFLIDLINVCGNTKIIETYPYILKTFIKKPLLSTRKKDNLRLAAGISLLKLDSTKSIKTIKNNMERGSKFYRQHCRQIVSQYSTSKVEI
ncbi:MAG: hypothetical protein P8078_04430, partial [bacterium]